MPEVGKSHCRQKGILVVANQSRPIPLNEPQNTAPRAPLAPSPLAGEGWGEGDGAPPMAWFTGCVRMDHPSPYPLPQGERANEALSFQGFTVHSTELGSGPGRRASVEQTAGSGDPRRTGDKKKAGSWRFLLILILLLLLLLLALATAVSWPRCIALSRGARKFSPRKIMRMITIRKKIRSKSKSRSRSKSRRRIRTSTERNEWSLHPHSVLGAAPCRGQRIGFVCLLGPASFLPEVTAYQRLTPRGIGFVWALFHPPHPRPLSHSLEPDPSFLATSHPPHAPRSRSTWSLRKLASFGAGHTAANRSLTLCRRTG